MSQTRTRVSLMEEMIAGDAPAIVTLRRHIAALAERPVGAVLVVAPTGTEVDAIPHLLAMTARALCKRIETICCRLAPHEGFADYLTELRASADRIARDARPTNERPGTVFYFDDVAYLSDQQQEAVRRLLTGAQRTDQKCVIVAAIPSSPGALRDKGCLRSDLYLALARDGVLQIPPLSERCEDIPMLANLELRRFSPSHWLANDALRLLMRCKWPGNRDQLRSVVRWCALQSPSERIDSATVREGIAQVAGVVCDDESDEFGSLASSSKRVSFYRATEELQRRLLIRALESSRGNQTEAGLLLRLHEPTGDDESATRVRKLAHRKFRYWWQRVVQVSADESARVRPDAGPTLTLG
jgi:DNA-binding NtrC family response regulator